MRDVLQLTLKARERDKSTAVGVQGQGTAQLMPCERPNLAHCKLRLALPGTERVNLFEFRFSSDGRKLRRRRIGE